MKYYLLILFLTLTFENNVYAPKRYDPTPAELKYRNSLRKDNDPSKDVRLQKRVTLPALTARALLQNSAQLPKHKKYIYIPPIALQNLPTKK
jgi:hypothetical protein